MNKELEKVCEELANRQRLETGYRPYVTKRAFKTGFQAAIESEQVKALIEALKFYAEENFYTKKFEHDLVTEYGELARKALEAWEGK